MKEFPKLSHNKDSTYANRRNVSTTAVKGDLVTMLPELSKTTRHSNMDKLLRHRELPNVRSITLPTNNLCITVRNNGPPLSPQFSPRHSSHNTYPNPPHPVLKTAVSSSSLKGNCRKGSHPINKLLSQAAYSSEELLKTVTTSDKDRKAEGIRKQFNPHTYNSLNTIENISLASHVLLLDTLTRSTDDSGRNEAMSTSQMEVWQQFETHIKMMDGLTNAASRSSVKTFKCSGDFQAVLTDMYRDRKNESPETCRKSSAQSVNITIYATKFLGKVKARNKFRNYTNGMSNYGRSADKSGLQGTNRAPSKGWRLIRQRVKDIKAHERMPLSTKMQDVPPHSLMGLSDFERTRRDLYERYGIIPTRRNDGTVTQENTMLSERARTFLESRDQRSMKSTKYNSLGGFVDNNRLVQPLV